MSIVGGVICKCVSNIPIRKKMWYLMNKEHKNKRVYLLCICTLYKTIN